MPKLTNLVTASADCAWKKKQCKQEHAEKKNCLIKEENWYLEVDMLINYYNIIYQLVNNISIFLYLDCSHFFWFVGLLGFMAYQPL